MMAKGVLGYQAAVLKDVISECALDNGVIFTGEKNITISKEALVKRILENKHGDEYLDVLQCEHPILERQGLVHGYIVGQEIMFDINDYDALISAVNAFYVSYQAAEDDEA